MTKECEHAGDKAPLLLKKEDALRMEKDLNDLLAETDDERFVKSTIAYVRTLETELKSKG